MIIALESMHERFLFMDIHARGHYVDYAIKEWERIGNAPKMETEDEKILAEGTVDYIGFSYYMSNTVKVDVNEVNAGTAEGNRHSVKNPYVKVSDWGCIDVVSFTTGELAKRYGFIYVDLNDDGSGTCNRYKKSFDWYKKIIATNGEEI